MDIFNQIGISTLEFLMLLCLFICLVAALWLFQSDKEQERDHQKHMNDMDRFIRTTQTALLLKATNRNKNG